LVVDVSAFAPEVPRVLWDLDEAWRIDSKGSLIYRRVWAASLPDIVRIDGATLTFAEPLR
jgi:hypothetical protein